MPSRWDSNLLRSIRAGDCVAFVGAGFTKAVEMPLWRPLIVQLIDTVAKSTNRADLIEYARFCVREGQLPRAASVLRRADNERRIDEELKNAFDGERLYNRRPSEDPKKVEMRKRLVALTSIPWAGYITTNYDTLITEHLSRIGRACTNLCTTPYDNLGRTLKSSERPFFIHLHGSVSTGSLILSEDDYDEAYLASPPLQSFLRAIFLRYTVIFIGTLVEDRFVELRRQLQLLFRDRRALPSSPLMSPEYVLLAENEKQRGNYLESTGGFRPIYYSNESGNHEGLVGALTELHVALSERAMDTLDSVNRRLLEIVRKYPEGINQTNIVREFWVRGPAPDHPDLTTGELFFRLFFLIYKQLITLDNQYDTFKPVISGKGQSVRKTRHSSRS